MLKIIRTDSENNDFRILTELLDNYLKVCDGDDHSFYSQFNKSESIKYTLIAFEEGYAVACGALREYSDRVSEIKRMFVRNEFRGKGYGKKILDELEAWSSELGFSECILETGKIQTEAVRLYKRSGYKIIPNYFPYENTVQSVCMKKIIK